jgi:hypothetical protein
MIESNLDFFKDLLTTIILISLQLVLLTRFCGNRKNNAKLLDLKLYAACMGQTPRICGRLALIYRWIPLKEKNMAVHC